MTRGIELFFTLFNNLATFIALVAFYGYLIRKYHTLFWVHRQILTGILFGVFAIGCMYARIQISEGVIVDQRNAIVILSGAFGGPISALFSAVMAGTLRFYLGGTGLTGGIVNVVISAIAGSILYRYKTNFESIKKAAVYSLIATLAIIPGFLFVKDLQTGWQLFKAIGLPFSTATYVGVFLIGFLLKKQEQSFSIEQSFRQSQERLELALTGANDGHWDWNLRTDTVYYSPRYKEMLGYTDEEFPDIRESWIKNVLPEDEVQARAILKTLIDGEAEHAEHEFRMRHKDGSLHWILTKGTGIKDENGRVFRLAGTQTDITARKQAEEALRRSEQKARAILNTSYQLFGMLELDGTLIDINQTALNIEGVPKSDVIGRPLWQSPAWSDSIELQERLREAIKRAAAGESVQFEATHPTPDGGQEHVDVTLRPVKEDDGKIQYLITEGRSITARKQAEKKLSDEHRRLTNIIESTQVGTWEWNVQTGETIFNDIWAQIAGYTLEELAPVSIETWNSLVHPEDLKRSAEVLQKHFDGELPYYEIECRIKHKDGRWIWIYDRGRVMTQDAYGAPLLMLGTHQDITERKQQARALRESELRFHKIIDASPLPFLLEDDSGKFIYMNPAFTETFGYTIDDIPHVDDFWPTVYPDPAYREEVKKKVLEVFKLTEQGGAPCPPVEARICCKDGSFRTVSGSMTTLGGTSKTLRLGVFFDVTLIRQISERLQTILAYTSDGMHVINENGYLVEFSKSFSHMLGYTAEETAQLHMRDWDKYAPVEKLSSWIQTSMNNPTTVETRHLRKNGEMLDVEISARGIILDGQPMLYASSRDITARKQAENQLKQALMEQSAIMENANVGIIQVKDRKIVKCNKKMADIFGYEVEEMIDKSTHMFYESLEHYEIVGRKILPHIFSGGIYTSQRELARKDDTRVWVKISGTAIDVNAPKSGSIWVFEDFSEAKARELELQAAKAEAEAANTLKSEFLANMSHEIRTPMNGVIGMTDLLMDTRLSPEQWHYANAIHSSGKLLLGLINDILDFSKIEAGKLEMETIEFDLFSLLDDFLDSMFPRVHEKNLELLCSIAPGTPAMLKGDPGRLRQILTNLAGNAVKFTQTGEILIKVSVVKDDETTCLIRFVVKDTGIGIPENKIAMLFDKFSQVDASTTRKYGGSGLGLAIAKQLVELMAGEINVFSQEGQGSEFQFTARFEKRKVTTGSDQPPVPVDLHGLRILVVDDNTTNREILTTQLKAWGMRPDESPNGPHALDQLEKAFNENDPYKITVIDMQMPEMDGETLGRAIKDDPNHALMHIIMLTSMGRRGDAKRFEAAGFNAYANKPIRPRELLSILINVVSGGSAAEDMVTRHSAREEQHLFNLNARALVVEDNNINRQVAVGTLKKLGLYADTASDGIEAIKTLTHTPYNLVFMDIQMPGMDGYQATARIRDPETGVLNSDIPIIAMTAHAMQGYREKCLSAGMNDYVSKPIDKTELAKVLKRWLPAFAPPASEVQLTPSTPNKEIPKLSGIAVQEALLFLEMDFNAYKTYLLTFNKDAQNAIKTLQHLVAQNNPAEVSALAHKLVGAAGNLRAFQVQVAASKLEQAAEQGQIPEPLVNELEKALQIFIDTVTPLGETESTDKTGNIDLDAAYQFMDKIEALITSSDIVEADYFADLKSALGGCADPITLSKLENSLQDFDYQTAHEAVKEIRTWMDNQSAKEKEV
nr:PAS domain S-box protein [uncultured Desulfobacter sp.]